MSELKIEKMKLIKKLQDSISRYDDHLGLADNLDAEEYKLINKYMDDIDKYLEKLGRQL